MKSSNKNIPDNLSDLLQKSSDFEVWFFDSNLRNKTFYFESEYLDFSANQVNKNVDNNSKTNLISSFLSDAEKGGEGSRCWIPHHGIRANYDDQLLEIAVCFLCGWYRGEILEETFYGTFPDEKVSESKKFFDEIIVKSKNYEP